MGFIPREEVQVGSTVRLNDDVKTLAGTFTKGTVVTVTAIDDYGRGYTILDEEGNRAVEIGFDVTLIEQ